MPILVPLSAAVWLLFGCMICGIPGLRVQPRSGIDLVTLAATLGHSRIHGAPIAHPTEQHQTNAMKHLEEFNAQKQIAEFERESLSQLQ